MRSILSRLVVAGMLVSISAAAVFGRDPTMALKSEWSAVSKGRTEFEVSDAALLPSTLALAAEQSGCSYKDDIKNAPVRFMRPESHRLAIVFCSGIIGSHQIFDVSNVLRPRLLELPFLVQPEGVGTTARPGWITWEKEANVFQAETGSDMLPSPGCATPIDTASSMSPLPSFALRSSTMELANGSQCGTRHVGPSLQNRSRAVAPLLPGPLMALDRASRGVRSSRASPLSAWQCGLRRACRMSTA